MMLDSPSPTETTTFRAMTAADVAMARILWANADGVELAEGDDPEQLRAYLTRNPGISQVALAGDRLIGAVLAGHDGRRGVLYHLAVRPEARRHGIARALVERSLGELRAAGITRALILVAADNLGGAEFWRRQGWEELTFAKPMAVDL